MRGVRWDVFPERTHGTSTLHTSLSEYGTRDYCAVVGEVFSLSNGRFDSWFCCSMYNPAHWIDFAVSLSLSFHVYESRNPMGCWCWQQSWHTFHLFAFLLLKSFCGYTEYIPWKRHRRDRLKVDRGWRWQFDQEVEAQKRPSSEAAVKSPACGDLYLRAGFCCCCSNFADNIVSITCFQSIL